MTTSGWATGTAALFLLVSQPLAAKAEPVWIGSWGRPLVAGPADRPDPKLADATIRTVVRLSAGGSAVRLRFSNAFGTAPLTIDAVHLARAKALGSDEIDPASDRAVTFGGAAAVEIPPGADYWSDPIALPVDGLATLAITYHLPQAPGRLSTQRLPEGTVFVAHGAAPAGAHLDGAEATGTDYQLAGVEVAGPRGARTVAAIGDSITDVGGGRVTGRGRWTDVLAQRLQAVRGGRAVGVVNLGISGGRVAKEESGPSALARFDRNVLSQPNLRTLIVFEGVNDLGKLVREGPVTPETRAAVVRQVIAGYRQMIARAHDHGIRVIGATITPLGGNTIYRNDASVEADRQVLNAWIKAPGHFDGVIDFAAVVADPAQPDRIAPALDSGDHLHPSADGQDAMGAAVPLALVMRR